MGRRVHTTPVVWRRTGSRLVPGLEYPPAALEIDTGFESKDDSPAGRGGTPFETYAQIGFHLWMLLALTLIFPGWWLVRRNLLSRRGSGDAHSNANGVRRAVWIASVISLVCCLTVLTLWITSHWEQSELTFATEGTRKQRTISPQLVADFTSGELRILAALDNYPRGEGDTTIFHQLAHTSNYFQWASWSPPDRGS